MTKKIKWILGATILTSTIAIVPIAVVSCGSNSISTDQVVVNDYITSVEALTGDQVISGNANQLVPTTITNANYATYLNNVPTPATNSGIILTFAITTSDVAAGTATIIIVATVGSFTRTSTSITVNGFSASNQVAVNDYIASVNALTGDQVISGNTNQLVPTTITNADYATYLNNVPTPTTNSGIILTFTLTNSNIANGTVNMTITATIASAIKTSNIITISGFLTAQSVVDNYIASVEALTGDQVISGNANQLVPTTIINSDYISYLNNVPVPNSKIVLTFNLTNPNATNGIVNMTITATIGSTSKTSNIITVSGFLTTAQSIVNNYIASVNALTGNNVISGNVNQFVPATITNADYATYLNNVPTINNGITLTFVLTNPNATNGTVNMTITATIGSFTKTSNLITVSGFLTPQSAVNNYITSVEALTGNNVISGNVNQLVPATITNADYATYLNNVPNINNGITLTFNLTNSNTTNGTVNMTITATIGSAAKTSTSITVSGFRIIATSTVITANQFANYWASTPPTGNNNLGNSGNVPSLYISDPNGVNTFNSSATIPTSGTSLPIFISNVSWPNGLTNDDVSSWTETGDNSTGTATYIVIFNNKITAELTVTGFMSELRITNLKLMSINTASDIGTILTPANGTAITNDVVAPGITGMNWNTNGSGSSGLDMSLFGNSVTSYAIANSNPSAGTISVIVTFASGVTIALPVSGFKQIAS